MPSYVVDASVGAKWFMPEVYTENAECLLDGDHNLLVPDLFYVEITNILWKRGRSGVISTDEVLKVLEKLASFPLEVFLSAPLLPVAMEIATQMDRGAYDSLYLALALREQAQMVTADQKFFNSLRGSPFASHLVWIADLPS